MSENKQSICYELKIQVPEMQKEVVAHVLEQLEIGDFIYGEIDCDIEAEYDPSRANQDLYEKLNMNPPIIIYNEDKEYLSSIELALRSLFPKVGILIENHTFLIQEIADQNWRESWKQSFKPVLIGDIFAILPPWENTNLFPQKYKIVINPGMAFGTGQHETTRLCLEMMLQYEISHSFLDVGTGSGILAIAAKYLGAKTIIGNDIDPDCHIIAEENAKNNGFDSISFIWKPLSEIDENNFDVIVANIQSKPLKTLVPDILKRVSENGVVILSGILVTEKDDFIGFLKQNHAKVIKTQDLNHWCAIVCGL